MIFVESPGQRVIGPDDEWYLKLIHILCHGHLVLRDTVRLIEKFLLDGRLMDRRT